MGRWGDGISRLSRLSLALALPKQHFGCTKNPGACFWGRKKPLREWGHALPRVSSQNRCFWPRKNLGACFWGRKKPLREARGLTPWFWARTGLEPHPQDQVPREGVQSASAVLRGNPYHQSSPGFEPGASGVRRPCANPLGNLTTVGHLAVVSPDLNTHFQTRKTSFSDT